MYFIFYPWYLNESTKANNSIYKYLAAVIVAINNTNCKMQQCTKLKNYCSESIGTSCNFCV